MTDFPLLISGGYSKTDNGLVLHRNSTFEKYSLLQMSADFYYIRQHLSFLSNNVKHYSISIKTKHGRFSPKF